MKAFMTNHVHWNGCFFEEQNMGGMHGRRQRGAGIVAPLDFHAWYRYSR